MMAAIADRPVFYKGRKKGFYVRVGDSDDNPEAFSIPPQAQQSHSQPC